MTGFAGGLDSGEGDNGKKAPTLQYRDKVGVKVDSAIRSGALAT